MFENEHMLSLIGHYLWNNSELLCSYIKYMINRVLIYKVSSLWSMVTMSLA